MINPEFDGNRFGERLEADAVCAPCGSVNPEGSLICRTCGNNLRDQRLLRMSADQQLESEGPPIERGRFLVGALTVFGILLVFFTLWNIGGIEDWLVDIQNPTTNYVAGLWEEPANEVFAGMLEELDATPLSRADGRAALSSPEAADDYEGIYVVGLVDDNFGAIPKGMASVRIEGDDVYFVATLGEEREVRGIGQLAGSSVSVGWESAGTDDRGDFYAVSGVAIRQADGSFACFGESEIAEVGFDFVACRMHGQ
jgi:hypothetical protein